MNLKALSAFCQIQRQGSLSAAAQAMNLSQPAVSRLVSGLEHEIGFALFHRDKRALRPTDEGRRFQREAERILAGIEQLGGIARDIRRGGGQSLRVVALCSAGDGGSCRRRRRGSRAPCPRWRLRSRRITAATWSAGCQDGSSTWASVRSPSARRPLDVAPARPPACGGGGGLRPSARRTHECDGRRTSRRDP